MVTKDYKPPMVPVIDKGQIRISKEYLNSLAITAEADKEYLQLKLTGQSICPAWLWFEDEPRARQLLKVKEGSK